MDIFDILKNNERPVFVLDDIEDKKTKSLVTQINKQMTHILEKYEEFNEFAKSQLKGEYNKKIVAAKSLQRAYGNWATVNNACIRIAKEETDAINSFESARNAVVSNLKVLLNDSKKLPVISAYDVFGDQFVLAKKGHSIIILGENNTFIIETIINELENKLIVEGNYKDVNPIELEANYENIEKNIKACKKEIEFSFSDKASKEEKLLLLVKSMEKAGKDLVFFATYKNDLKLIGCNMKEVDVYERELFKKYVPIKKQLSKLLSLEFVDICDLSHNEAEFPTQEFKAINDQDLEK